MLDAWRETLQRVHGAAGSSQAQQALMDYLQRCPDCLRNEPAETLADNGGHPWEVYQECLRHGVAASEVQAVAEALLAGRRAEAHRRLAVRYLAGRHDWERLAPALRPDDAGSVLAGIETAWLPTTDDARYLAIWAGLNARVPEDEPDDPEWSLLECGRIGLWLRERAQEEYRNARFRVAASCAELRRRVYRLRNCCALQSCMLGRASLAGFARICGLWARRVLLADGSLLIPWSDRYVPQREQNTPDARQPARLSDRETEELQSLSPSALASILWQWRHWSSWQPRCEPYEW